MDIWWDYQQVRSTSYREELRKIFVQMAEKDSVRQESELELLMSLPAELGKPNVWQPDKGKVSIHIDCSATAEPAFEGRGGEELSAEFSVSSLQRCLLGGKTGSGAGIDLSSLIVVEGKVCWDLYIDGLVSLDGNLLDALDISC
ncbi:hypothetical protein QQ045_013224 [Rhodiola kirilowii]